MTKPKPEPKPIALDTLIDLGLLKYAGAMKRNMQKKGLQKGKAKCPFCEGHWHATLNGRKQHFHMRCDGTCQTFMME